MYAIFAIDGEGNKRYLPIRQCDIGLYQKAQEGERKAIARNGHDKVAAAHTFKHWVREMIEKL